MDIVSADDVREREQRQGKRDDEDRELGAVEGTGEHQSPAAAGDVGRVAIAVFLL